MSSLKRKFFRKNGRATRQESALCKRMVQIWDDLPSEFKMNIVPATSTAELMDIVDSAEAAIGSGFSSAESVEELPKTDDFPSKKQSKKDDSLFDTMGKTKEAVPESTSSMDGSEAAEGSGEAASKSEGGSSVLKDLANEFEAELGVSDEGYDPLEGPVKTRSYNQPEAGDELESPPVEEVPPEPIPSDPPPAPDSNQGQPQGVPPRAEPTPEPTPDDIPADAYQAPDEDEFAETEEVYEDDDVGGGEPLGGDNLKDMSPAQKRKAAEKTADLILNNYCRYAPMPFKNWSSFSKRKIKRLVDSDRLNVHMVIDGDGMTVEEYLQGVNQQVENLFEVDEETRQEIREPLVEVLMENEVALTPTQRLMIAVGSHLVQMSMQAFKISRENNEMLKTFERFHQENKESARPPRGEDTSQYEPNHEDMSAESDEEVIEPEVEEESVE